MKLLEPLLHFLTFQSAHHPTGGHSHSQAQKFQFSCRLDVFWWPHLHGSELHQPLPPILITFLITLIAHSQLLCILYLHGHFLPPASPSCPERWSSCETSLAA